MQVRKENFQTFKSTPPTLSPLERFVRREKQINIVKNSVEYKNYRLVIPKSVRLRKIHPVSPKLTPNSLEKYSNRRFNGIIKKWRQDLSIFKDIDQIPPYILKKKKNRQKKFKNSYYIHFFENRLDVMKRNLWSICQNYACI